MCERKIILAGLIDQLSLAPSCCHASLTKIASSIVVRAVKVCVALCLSLALELQVPQRDSRWVEGRLYCVALETHCSVVSTCSELQVPCQVQRIAV